MGESSMRLKMHWFDGTFNIGSTVTLRKTNSKFAPEKKGWLGEDPFALKNG